MRASSRGSSSGRLVSRVSIGDAAPPTTWARLARESLAPRSPLSPARYERRLATVVSCGRSKNPLTNLFETA